MPHSSRTSIRPTQPVPYELYIRLDELVATWPKDCGSWPERIVACCGFQAAELSLRLIDDATRDTRRAAFPERRVDRFVGHIVDGIELTCGLLTQARQPEAALLLTGEGSAPSPGFAILDRVHRAHVDRITQRFAMASAGLPFDIGIESQLREARRRHRLASLGMPGKAAATAVLDYGAVVSPDAAFRLYEPVPCGPEDHLFSTAHQITECWLRIAHYYLDEAMTLARQRQWAAAADALTKACDTLPLAVAAGQLLDQMVLADYHPLRVRLRDGSGAQSEAARQLVPAVRAAAKPVWTMLEANGLCLLDVFDQPDININLYNYLCALKTVSKRVQSFLFNHYLLALGVLGAHSLGSYGYEIRTLAERAARPLFPEINEAHHDYVMLTNFLHGEASGSIVLRNELDHGSNPYAITDTLISCPPGVIERRVADYFRFLEERDADGWVSLFEPVRGQYHDVPGTRPYLGQAHLRVFINGMFNAFSELHGTHSPPRIEGNTASVDWRFEAVSYHGRKVTFDGHEEFLFDEDGRLLKAVADWSPSRVARQLRGESGTQRRSDQLPRRRMATRANPRPRVPLGIPKAA